MKLTKLWLMRAAARGIAALLAIAVFWACDSAAQSVRVDITPAHAINFDPDVALGSSVDILPHKLVDTVYSEPVLKESLSAGWGPITYRQNTELTVAAWHWNPNGTWSDATHQSGYFTGSAEPKDFLRYSFGYPLPHRGNTRGADSADKFSRLTDGNPASYWKSNPYLTKKFTKEDDSLHPQWIVVDFEAPQDITAIRIAWANPYARKYSVQYWNGGEALDKQTSGLWSTFPSGEVQDGKGGTVLLKLSSLPVRTRYLRIWMTESSNTCDTHGSSWALTEPMTDLFAALWLADNAGSFLASGGTAFYHSPIQPESLHAGCHGWSTYGNFVANEKLEVSQYTSQYFASCMINIEWVKHGAGMHQLAPAFADVSDDAGHTLITAYAAKRPDGEWSLLLTNKDPSNAHGVRIEFDDASGAPPRYFAGAVTMVTFGAEQYVWHPEGSTSHADPDGPPASRSINVKDGAGFTSKASVTVLRGRLDRE